MPYKVQLDLYSLLHKSYLKDTNDFINKIAGIKAKEGAFIATIDVDSLYTNIDNTYGLEAVKNYLIRIQTQRGRIEKFYNY